MKNWGLFLLSIIGIVNLVAAPLNYQVLSMEMEGMYWKNQQLKGTVKSLNEKSPTIIEKTSFVKVPAFNKHNKTTSLHDNKLNTIIKTYDWTKHHKKLTFILDLGNIAKVDYIEIWQYPKKASLIENVEVYLATSKGPKGQILYTIPAKLTQNTLKASSPYALTLKVNKDAKYIKVVCSNYRPMNLALSEIKVFGKGNKKNNKVVQVQYLKDTFRLELENIQGPWKAKSNTSLGGAGVWYKDREYSFFVNKPGKSPKYNCFIRFNAKMPLEVKLGKTLVTLPKQKLKWAKVGTFSEDKILFTLNIDGRCNGWGDALLFTSDMKFDPNKFDALTLGQLAREVKPVPEFGELLLKKNPNIAPEDFAKQMLNHYGLTYHKLGKVVDENNNILVDGKPFFPILAYGLNPDNPRYYDTGCNTSHWVWKGWKHSTDKYVVGGRDRFAYDRQVRDFLNYNPKNVAFIHLFDEPENHPEFTYRKFVLLNALMKALMPNTVTSVNFAANSNSRDCFIVSDILSLDHYPISRGNIADIGYTIDYMRFYGKNRPLLFIAQAFKWNGINQKMPTCNELCAMSILPLIHGVKGIQWWETAEKNPTMDPKKLLRLTPVDYPVEWKRFCQLTKGIAAIQDGLLGPELKDPFKVITKSTAEFKVIVSSDRKKAYLLAVNPERHPQKVKVDFSKSPIKDLTLKAQNLWGCKFSINNSVVEFDFDKAGSGILTLESKKLAKLERLSHDEFMTKMKNKFLNVKPSTQIVVPVQKGMTPNFDKGVDLMQSWKSTLRPDMAKVVLNDAGLCIDFSVRYQMGKKSVETKRDGAVWKDLCMEIYLGKKGTENYSQLVVNTLNTQFDVKVVFLPNGKRKTDLKSTFKWQSKVSSNSEIANFQVIVPWSTMEQLIGVKKFEDFTLNICSQGRDWCGLTGGGYAVPVKFGSIVVKK